MKTVESIGIDAGSTTLKIVGVDKDKKIIFSIVEDADPRIELQTEKLMESIKKEYTIENATIIATGYGSNLIKADKKITEITCHAKGIYEYFKSGGTAVDIGGQDNKVILISKEGKVIDFIMNDKCASGTGRFLENTAWRLKIPIEKMAELALNSDDEVSISSTCAVFAESEVISQLSRGQRLEHVLKGLHRAMAKRITAMIYAIGFSPPLMLSGGVAKNKTVIKMLEDEMGEKPLIPDNPQIIGAFGAALLGIGS